MLYIATEIEHEQFSEFSESHLLPFMGQNDTVNRTFFTF